MDPISLGAAVVALAGTKAIEKVGGELGEAGWGLANKILGRVRAWFAETDDDAAAALAAVEGSTQVTGQELGHLAALIAARLGSAPKVASELGAMVEKAITDPLLAPYLSQALPVDQMGVRISLHAAGDGNIQAGGSIVITGDTTMH